MDPSSRPIRARLRLKVGATSNYGLLRPGRSALRSQTRSTVGKSAVACVLNARGAKLHVSRAKPPSYSNGSRCSPRRRQQGAHMLQPGTSRLLCRRGRRGKRVGRETTDAVFSCGCRPGAASPELLIHQRSAFRKLVFFLSFFCDSPQIGAETNPAGGRGESRSRWVTQGCGSPSQQNRPHSP